MSLYKFLAKDQSGKNVTGEVEAFDEKALVATLRSENLVPLEIRLHGSGKFKFTTSVPKFGGGISYSEIVSFTRQLSTMISSGLPIADSLVILEKQTKSHKFQKVLSSIVADVEGGMSLSASFSQHPKIFDQVYVKLIEAGETGGVLDKILSKLADTMEKEKEFKAKTRGAFIYPIIVVAVMLVVISIMLIFVIPKLTGIYEEIGVDLPLPTKILIATSDFTRSFWWLVILLGISAIWGIKNFAKTQTGAPIMSKFVLALPIWGKIRKSLVLSQFTRTLGLLLGAGIPIITALKVVADILASPTFEEGVYVAIDKVERGSPLYVPLVENPAFPPILGQMLRVGEETGKIDEILLRLSVYFEAESENLIRNLTVALEPIILVFLGIGVGVLVLSIILPIYNLTAQF